MMAICFFGFTGEAYASKICNMHQQTIYQDIQDRDVAKLLHCYLDARQQENSGLSFVEFQSRIEAAEAKCETEEFVTATIAQKAKCIELEALIRSEGSNEMLRAEKEKLGC